MVMVVEGTKLVRISEALQQERDKVCKFIKGCLDEDGARGSIVIEINEHDDDELICGVSNRPGIRHDELEEELAPLLQQKGIDSLDLLRFYTNTVTVKGKERIIVGEIRKMDYEGLAEYCANKDLDIDDCFYTILVSEKL